MISDARRGHVSPGIYTEEKDVLYSVKSLGITSLGLVGETLYGPAFQNVEISNWGEFVDYFGGTSPEKFKNGCPKYELPYVAKDYLTESNRLNVVRVLGLSGYEAGKAWVIWNNNKPAIVLRSKMSYGAGSNICDEDNNDRPTEIVTNISIDKYSQAMFGVNCDEIEAIGESDDSNDEAMPNRFKLVVECKPGFGYAPKLTYNVSLRPGDSDYIYNVLGNRPDNGIAPIYIEAVYESSFDENYIPASGDTTCLSGITSAETGNISDAKIYYEVKEVKKEVSGTTSSFTYTFEECEEKPGSISLTAGTISGGVLTSSNDLDLNVGMFVCSGLTGDSISYTDFKEGYRAAQTPWIVSDAVVKSVGSVTSAEVRKLFKFITISDGDIANFQVKVSIQNIDVTNGNFDVIVRDFNDTDANPIILESFRRCNLIEGDGNYIAYRIGSSDGGYISKSKYILVEMAEGEDFGGAIPAGFMGYPMPNYRNSDMSFTMKYNTVFRPEIKTKRQYFGMSNITGVDRDVLTYKGKSFYDYEPSMMTTGFHMDSAISGKVSVDGVDYDFTHVEGKKYSSKDTRAPRLINASYINETLYRDINTRKFTVCFYGGFDGWDLNRSVRTTGDDYKATKYNVSGDSFFKAFNNENDLNLPLNLPATAITSDYYAYLAGCRIFANPQDIDINIFATPGINWHDNTLLTEEIIDIIEDNEDGRGGDALYVMAAPGPESNVITAQDAVNAFDVADINSSYACTYFPWIMYYDSSNKRYINLPVTKDVIKNMAATDNKSFPWFAPAGTERGKVNCVKAVYKTTLADEDMLYNATINPVKSFAQDGVIIWGNKTTYPVETPNNRINVRRMMIRVKKLITEAAKHLIFEQYDAALEKQFRGIVEPILADVKANRGIIDYRVITECTPETRDQHILPAKILIKPTQSLEYISISFTVYPESVQFEE